MVRRRFAPPPPLGDQPPAVDLNLDPGRTPKQWIGFVGDISPLAKRTAVYAPGVAAFFADCDRMVGNLEGVITTQRWRPYRHNHTPRVLEDLAPLGDLPAWTLSVANNHAADYGDAALLGTLDHLDRHGVRWLGTQDRPCIDLAPGVTLTTWTRWLNRPTHLVPRHDPGVSEEPGLHIAFPHWGFEHERRPRPNQVPPAGYPLVVGHHSHLPQPFEQQPDGTLIAWSLGNLLTQKRLPVLGEGAILKVGLAPNAQRMPEVVRASFRLLRLDRSDPRYCRVLLRGQGLGV